MQVFAIVRDLRWARGLRRADSGHGRHHRRRHYCLRERDSEDEMDSTGAVAPVETAPRSHDQSHHEPMNFLVPPLRLITTLLPTKGQYPHSSPDTSTHYVSETFESVSAKGAYS